MVKTKMAGWGKRKWGPPRNLKIIQANRQPPNQAGSQHNPLTSSKDLILFNIVDKSRQGTIKLP